MWALFAAVAIAVTYWRLPTFAALPWIGAELGFFLDDVPVLGSIFITGKIAPKRAAISRTPCTTGITTGWTGCC